jgi:hypothetical protein
VCVYVCEKEREKEFSEHISIHFMHKHEPEHKRPN